MVFEPATTRMTHARFLTFELSKLAGFRCLKNVFNLRRQTYWLIDATDH